MLSLLRWASCGALLLISLPGVAQTEGSEDVPSQAEPAPADPEAGPTPGDAAQPDPLDAEQRGRAAFQRGAAAYDAGSYEDALVSFSEAYELTERPALLYNVALAQDRLRMDAAALRTFNLYLEAVPDTSHRQQVQSRIDALTLAENRRAAELAALEQARQDEEARRLLAEEEARNAEQPSRWWIGLIVGVVAVGAGVGLAVALSGRDDGFEQSDFGEVTTTLGSF